MSLATHPIGFQEVSTAIVSKHVQFARFFSIDFSSSYYNQPELEICRFDFRPTAYTQTYLTNHGLIFREMPAGLTVGMAIERRGSLIRALRGGAKDESEWLAGHLQEWMSFSFTAVDGDFGNYTNLSLAFDAKRECLYFSNTHAHRVRRDEGSSSCARIETGAARAQEANLGPCLDVGIARIVPKVGTVEHCDFPEDCEAIEVLNVVDEVVLCYPRTVPLKLLETASPHYIDSELVREYTAKHPGEPSSERNSCFIQFGQVGAGLYRIRFAGSLKEEETRLYPGAATNCLGFVDIQLADPGRTPTGVYPIEDLFGLGEPEFRDVAYVARFGARNTRWDYVIVPRPGERLLAAEFSDPDGVPVDFEPGRSVSAPQAANAQLFRSIASFAFQRKPKFWLKLRGSLEDRDGIASPKTVLVAALPTPVPLQISNIKSAQGRSERGGIDQVEKFLFKFSDETNSTVYVYL